MKDTASTPSDVVMLSGAVRVTENESGPTRTTPTTPASNTSEEVMKKAPQGHPVPCTASETNAVVPYHKSPTLYVGDLHVEVCEAALYDIFQALGPIHSIRICRDRVSRRSLGYGYVNFSTVQDAERALHTMNYYAGPQTFGRPLRLMWSVRDPSSRRTNIGNVFVKGLAESIDCKTLHDTFSQFGGITSCKVAMDEGGSSLGYGFVHFESATSAGSAIANVNGMLLKGAKVHVAHFKHREERESEGLGRPTFTNVYVKNLEVKLCEESALRDLFRAYGEITSVFIPRHDDGTPKLFAFINFASSDMARKAVEEMHGYVHRGDSTKNSGEDSGEKANEKAGENGKDGESGKRLYVTRAQKKSERAAELRKRFTRMRRERADSQQGMNLYVKYLAPDVDSQRLRAHFAEAGTITSCTVMRDSNGHSRGFGFVCYSTKEEANYAIQHMNGSFIESKRLYVAVAQRKEARRAQIRAQRALLLPWYMAPSSTIPSSPPLVTPPAFLPPASMYAQPNPNVHRHEQPAANLKGFTAPISQSPSLAPAPAHVSNVPPTVWNQRPTSHYPPRYVPMMHRFAQPYLVAQQQVIQQAMVAYPPLHAASTQTQPSPQHQTQTPHAQHVPGCVPYAAAHVPGHAQFAHHPAPHLHPDAKSNPKPNTQHAPPPPKLEPLTIEMLTDATPLQRKHMLGVRLFPQVAAQNRELATKITGMLLELDDSDVLHLLETPQALVERVREGERVLREHAETVAKEKGTAVNATDKKGSSNAMERKTSHDSEADPVAAVTVAVGN